MVIEDDDIVADAIVRALSAENYSVHRVSSAEAAQSAIANENFTLAVIDVGLSGADGLTLLRRLRRGGNSLPALVLTARCTLDDKVKALDLGADDFLGKPFETQELAARCRALLRRASGALDGLLEFTRMSVDLKGKRLSIDGADVDLTAREWRLLECLVRRAGQIVPKERVQQALSTSDLEMSANAVEVHVSRLRAKLKDAVIVRSLRGLGYRLEDAKAA